MSAPSSLHTTELAYVFSYMKVASVVGWGAAFTPEPGHEEASYAEGRERLLAAKRLIPGKQPGRHRFSDEFLSIALPLAEPAIVISAQRRVPGGVRTLTVHQKGADVVQLVRTGEDTFSVQRLSNLAAAATSAAAFVGTRPEPVETRVRIEANHRVLTKLDALAEDGQVATVVAALVRLGAPEAAAKSAVLAFSRPTASGVVNVLYCAANDVIDAEVYSVLTNAAKHSWIVFPPANADGPMVLERTSLAALAARILVALSARVAVPT